jgi:hypothetical protein
VKTKTKLVILELSGGLFGWIWIGASIVAIYFLYGVMANDAPWSNLLWSIVVGFVAKQIAAALNGNQRRLDYVDQLTERGYMPADAEFAWYTATNGGANLLRDLQRLELDDEIDRLESAIGTSSTENPGE